jgi:peroxiredoxin Q/BCP
MLEIGAQAPDFTLPDGSGTDHRLAEALEAGPVVLAFMKANCGACTVGFPYLERLHQAYGGEAWSIWGISQSPATAAESFAKSTGVTFPLLIESEDFPVSGAYDPPATPTIFLIEPSGRVRSGHHGFAKSDLNALAVDLASTLEREPVVVAPPDDGQPDFRPG